MPRGIPATQPLLQLLLHLWWHLSQYPHQGQQCWVMKSFGTVLPGLLVWGLCCLGEQHHLGPCSTPGGIPACQHPVLLQLCLL